MAKYMKWLGAVSLAIAALSQTVLATGFYAVTNQMGYRGSVWNITHNTGPWQMGSPRNAYWYVIDGIPGVPEYDILMTDWLQPVPSNAAQTDWFFQLYELGNPSVTGAEACWDPTRTQFTATVSGKNAPYPWSRFWQPDGGHAWGVTFKEYSYTFTATFGTAATPANGGFKSSSAPTDIVGSFTGQFVSTYDAQNQPMANGDTYGFAFDFDDDWFNNPTDRPIAVYNEFATVPEPLTAVGGLTALAALSGYVRRRLTVGSPGRC